MIDDESRRIKLPKPPRPLRSYKSQEKHLKYSKAKKQTPEPKEISQEIRKLEDVNYSRERKKWDIEKLSSILLLEIYLVLANIYIHEISMKDVQDIGMEDLVGFLIIWSGIISCLLCILGSYGTILLWMKVRFTIFFLLILKVLLSIFLLLYTILVSQGQIIIYNIKLNTRMLGLLFAEFIVFTMACVSTLRRYINTPSSKQISKYKLYQFVLERRTMKSLTNRQRNLGYLMRIISCLFSSSQIFFACLGVVGIIKFGEGYTIKELTNYFIFLSWRILSAIILLMANFEITISILRGNPYLSSIYTFFVVNTSIMIYLIYQMKIAKLQNSFFRWDSTDTSQSLPIFIDYLVTIIPQWALYLSIPPIKHPK